MKKLQEIVRVVGRKRLKKIEVFNETGSLNQKSLYYRLYKGIKDGKYKTDEDAARDLFDTDASDKKYLMLKSRVRTRLLNSLFFLDSNSVRVVQVTYKCYRNLISAKFLVLNGAVATGVGMFRATLNEAEKFGLTDVSVECLRKLRYNASFSGNETEFHRYNERFNELQQILSAEYKVEEYYQKMILPFGKADTSIPEMASEAFGYVAEIETLRERGTSYNLELTYYRLRVVANQIAGDHHGVFQACEEVEAYLKTQPLLTTKVRFGEFALYRMVAYLHLGEYENGKRTATKSLHFFREGSITWMIFLENYFLLCMHTRNYEKANEIYVKVVNNPRYEAAGEVRREKWKIFDAFLKYMETGILPEAENERAKFNIWKFLNEVPNYSKDKRGLNIAILILQVLFLLDRKDFDGIIQRAEALKVYCSRYLKRDENYRSNCFLKMVLIMEKKDFDYEHTRKIAEKYHSKLKTARFNYQSGNMASLEIIPYEQLWQTILTKLKG